ncbi:glycosyltransferase [Candidatus Saccharibacteria bacterium]|nr:glycosyltransferase [Candidatus Saccharibacteria bacterium]
MRVASNDLADLSIIIPAFNAGKSISVCLERLVSISGLNIEVIIIDDGSTDNTAKIVKEFSERNRNIVFRHQVNRGVSAARNRGIEIAQGKYIGFVDMDDDISEMKYEKLYDMARKNELDIAMCNFYEIVNGERISSKYNYKKEIVNGTEVAKRYLMDKISNGVWDKIFDRELIKELRFDEELAIGEDILFCLQAFMRSNKVGFLEDAWYGYVQNDDSAMHSKMTKLEQYLKVVERIPDEDKNTLQSRYPEEFRFFTLEMKTRTIHAISMATAGKRKKLEALKRVLKLIDIKEIIREKQMPKSIRIEMRILDFFGPRVHLMMLPLYKTVRKRLR